MENVIFIVYASGIRLLDCSKLPMNHINDDDVKIFRHNVIANFFKFVFVSHVRLSYWSTFHANIITLSVVMTIFFYKRLNGNPEMENSQSEFCPISRDWDMLGILNFAGMSAMKCYWMLENARVTAFTVSEGNPTVGVKLLPPPTIKLNQL